MNTGPYYCMDPFCLHVILKLFKLKLFCETWKKIFWDYYFFQWAPMLFGSQCSSKKSPFAFHRRKKVIQVRNNMRVSKWWHYFHFWLDCPFKHSIKVHRYVPNSILMHYSITFCSIIVRVVCSHWKCTLNTLMMHLNDHKNKVWTVGHFMHSTVAALII